jgi:hypothetical protein
MQCELSASEAASGAKSNPLNTTERMPGSWTFNSANVQNYRDDGEGLEATNRTFDTPHQGYDRIEYAIKHNLPARTIVSRIGDTNWGTAKTLMAIVRVEIARRFPSYLRKLEQTEIAHL